MHGVRYGGMAAFVVAAGLVVGCGGGVPEAEVSGTISYDGKPIEDGAITFFPTDGKGSTGGGTIKDGKYSATKVAVGKTKGVISGSKVVGKKKIYPTPDSPEMPVTAEILPAKYSGREKTELIYETKRGSNEKDWDLAK